MSDQYEQIKEEPVKEEAPATGATPATSAPAQTPPVAATASSSASSSTSAAAEDKQHLAPNVDVAVGDKIKVGFIKYCSPFHFAWHIILSYFVGVLQVRHDLRGEGDQDEGDPRSSGGGRAVAAQVPGALPGLERPLRRVDQARQDRREPQLEQGQGRYVSSPCNTFNCMSHFLHFVGQRTFVVP